MNSLFSSPLACLLLAAAPLAGAAELSTADGTGSDNQVMGFGNERETFNKGRAGSFEVRGHAYSGNNFYGVLRFDLSAAPGITDAAVATLTLAVTGEDLTPGTITLYGLDEGFAGGPDGSGKPELSEQDFEEGAANFEPADSDAALTGDNAPGLQETATGTAALTWFGAPLTELAECEVAAGATEVVFGPTAEIAAFLSTDTNGTAVFYLASDDAFVQLGTKEGGQPATLTTD
ncbi:hypothetical protein [Phycisphaera mikurensis]|uniref:Uncharacterized protein n=1 Tax=Phycisphaera mikurensis (strain NBRC 102666 / KCTC 22515 / FYK2301M01) TaxID=1142394 RepID=I0ICX1_PHYMF|nr:hypothetical protein [Phycisphaera mikurensis]MBB6442239.1 hypothetical protein [Phycisphaera mikurensis]BAM03109.1 hypothetical protein PSMK_09500 [Phycisphaera mikurensis NBRC 102666]